MGLVIVVVLISLIMLFVIQFSVLRAREDTRQAFTQEQIAANTVNALVITTTQCQGLDVTELIQDCASFRQLDCGGSTSCAFVSSLAEGIFNGTLQQWGKAYLFTVTSGSAELIRVARSACPASKYTSVYPIPSSVGGERIAVRLEVCGDGD